MLKHFIRVSCMFGMLCLSALPAWAQAQSSSADITGSVSDPTKAVVSGATVTAVNLATGLARTATTDAEGSYRITLLPPGEYEVKVKAEGFNLQVKRGIVLTVGQTAVIKFDLLIGVTTETEVIETSVPLIETERTHQASTITQNLINDLPIDGRNFLDFAKLTPGVVEENPAVTRVVEPYLQTSGLSFAGQNGRSNNVQIDGVDQNDITSNGVRPTLSQEAIREFQINRHGYNAEFGRASGGVINIVSKSGSNQFHGNVYNFFRNEQLDARNTFATFTRQDPPFKRNQPGFTFGGPIQKDKTFFFVAYEGLIRRESAITTILADPSILQPTAGQQDLINTLIGTGVPALVAQGQQLQALLTTGPNSPFPLVSQPFPQNRNTFDLLARSTGIFPVEQTASTGSLRLDQAFNERDSVFVRYSMTNDASNNVGIGGLNAPSTGFDISLIDNTGVVGETHVFRNGATNEFRFAAVRNVVNANTVDPFGPRFELPGIGSFGRDFASPQNRTQFRQQFVDNFSLKLGRNNIKFGGDFSRYTLDVLNPLFGGGTANFNQLPIPLGAVLGNAATGLVTALSTPRAAGGLGRPDLVPVITQQPLTTVQQTNFGFMSLISQGFGDPRSRLAGKILGLYAQNGLQVRPNLYLSFGLRYDYELQPRGTPRDNNNFGPRFGFTYDPFNNGRTLIRGGGGLYYQSLFTATAFISRILGGGQISNILVTANPLLSPINPNSPCGQAFVSAQVPPAFCFYQQLVSRGLLSFSPKNGSLPESVYSDLLGLNRQTSNNRLILRLDQGAVNPYSLQGSLGVDQQFGRDLAISVNYIVNHGVKFIRPRQANALPDPNVPDLLGRPALVRRIDQTKLADFIFETAGNSIYHGFAVSVTKRFSRFYEVIGSYTLGKAIDDATDLNLEEGPQDPNNSRLDRSLSSFDVRQRLSIASIFESPFQGGSGRPLYDRIFANFFLSPILTARRGFPLDIRTGADVNFDTNLNDRPFAVGRNTGVGPGFVTMDMRVGRRIRFGADGARSVEAVFDAFNLFNRVNFKEVNSNTSGVLRLDQMGITDVRLRGTADKSASSFGGFTSAYEPRVIQFGLKLNF